MRRVVRIGLAAVTALAMAACSGGDRNSNASSGTAKAGRVASAAALAPPPTLGEAARFLTQASFGATDADIAGVQQAGFAAWIAQQEALPVQGSSAVAFMTARQAANTQTKRYLPDYLYEAFWRDAATAPDQLRQRVKLAYSEIFVVSVADPNVDPLMAGSYYDMLGANAFGNFRTLLERVALHPAMGVYLSWIANQKSDPATGRHPDQNFARESMQLMTIGLFQLNPDGSRKLDAKGQTISTYSGADIAGLADVLTGYSWYSAKPTSATFATRPAGAAQVAAMTTPMIPYPAYHETGAKSFLGTTILAQATSNPPADLKVALDTLFNHPNVGPFIGRQLIQRLVTSNPSPDYVARVAAVFADNGKGVRGDMGAVIAAILLDPEARNPSNDPAYGKLREPVVRMANWMRAFNAQSASGNWLLASTSANTSLDQSLLTAQSVFNFWRPGFTPPGAKLGELGYVGPEFQAVDEVSVAGYLNTMQAAIGAGVGTGRDVTPNYTTETGLAGDPNALADRVNLLLLNGQMSPNLRSRITGAVSSVALPAAAGTARSTALTNRAKLAIFMAMASPEYLAQR
jgi:uncharacterized protein (DUF1800 family)